MHRLVYAAVLGAAIAAHAQPTTRPGDVPPGPSAPAAPAPAAPAAQSGSTALPAAGDSLALRGNSSWPKLDWLYDVPSTSDAAGKIVVHWFCAPKASVCPDDLARIVTLRETGKVYIVAYVNGTKPQAQKLDPIRESEGVGRGTVAYGPRVTRLMKDLGIVGPASIIVGIDGTVQLVSTGSSPAELDARDAKVASAIGAIKEYVSSSDGPRVVKAGERFQLSMGIKLASWLKYSDQTPKELDISVPRDIKCESTKLRGDQIKIDDHQLTATVTCTGARGVYEASGELRFGYDAPGGGTGVGAQSARWKFEIKD